MTVLYFSRYALFFLLCFAACSPYEGNEKTVRVQYTIGISEPAENRIRVEMDITGFKKDSLVLKMPEWMPGYYQIMDYSDNIVNFTATGETGQDTFVRKADDHTWVIGNSGIEPLRIGYDIVAQRRFVANSYVDSTHAYLVPAATFLYLDGNLDIHATIKLNFPESWTGIATGLEPVEGSSHKYMAPDFDILYDCPILMGNLEELPPFYIHGIKHRFTGWRMGQFDRDRFMADLKKAVETAIGIFGEIPYKEYAFIAIGPGRGGIEHLNNTTVSFDGNRLNTPRSWNAMLAFLTHEYFHHYNVKRIRPYELGPFDYERENRTNQLWISEGLTVYYEYLILRRAGLIDEPTLYASIEAILNAYENDPGRHYQSLQQASFYTWEEGPFGGRGPDGDRSISYLWNQNRSS